MKTNTIEWYKFDVIWVIARSCDCPYYVVNLDLQTTKPLQTSLSRASTPAPTRPRLQSLRITYQVPLSRPPTPTSTRLHRAEPLVISTSTRPHGAETLCCVRTLRKNQNNWEYGAKSCNDDNVFIELPRPTIGVYTLCDWNLKRVVSLYGCFVIIL